MCKECWEQIAKADDTEFLDGLELTHAERAVLEELYKQGETRIVEILELQGKELHEAILELSEDLLIDIGELGKVLASVQTGELFTIQFEQAVYDAFTPLFHLAGETELVELDPDKTWSVKNKAASRFAKNLQKLVPDMNGTSADVMTRHSRRPSRRERHLLNGP